MYVSILFFFWQSKFASKGIIFIHALFFRRDFFTGNIFFLTFPDFVKFVDISKTWKMYLLFSRLSRTCENPVYACRPSGQIFANGMYAAILHKSYYSDDITLVTGINRLVKIYGKLCSGQINKLGTHKLS